MYDSKKNKKWLYKYGKLKKKKENNQGRYGKTGDENINCQKK